MVCYLYCIDEGFQVLLPCHERGWCRTLLFASTRANDGILSLSSELGQKLGDLFGGCFKAARLRALLARQGLLDENHQPHQEGEDPGVAVAEVEQQAGAARALKLISN